MDQTAYNYCALPLAAWACRPDHSRGRLYAEPESQYRTCFQRDRDRIIHSGAFRRLKYKTQVFVYHEGDNYRTRLTHTLEVAQIARTLARALMANEDLAEAVALSHDLGHTPFAHVGEEVLDECMRDVGGFDHNDQSLRVLTTLEHKYPGWPGLNLSWETLEGIVKHNGPVKEPTEAVLAVQKRTDLMLDSYATVEAQIAALADDIAYNNHDIEDGLSAGLFTVDDIVEVPLLAEVRQAVEAKYPGISGELLTAGVVRQAIGAMVEDVLKETKARLAALNAQSADDIRAAGRPMVAFSPAMALKVEGLRKFLWDHMYRHSRVTRMRLKVSRIIQELYEQFMLEPRNLPEEWRSRVLAAGNSERARARVVADYIAGMTDRFAIKEHENLFNLYRDLR